MSSTNGFNMDFALHILKELPQEDAINIHVRLMADYLLTQPDFDLMKYMDQKTKNSALSLQVRNGHFVFAKHLLDNGASFDRHALHREAENGRLNAIVFLIAHGAPRDGKGGCTVLHAAAKSNDPARVEYLIKNGFEFQINVVDSQGNTPLNSCLHVNNRLTEKKLIEIFIDNGANVRISGGCEQLTSLELLGKYFGNDFISSLKLENDPVCKTEQNQCSHLPISTTEPPTTICQTGTTDSNLELTQKIMKLEESFQASQAEIAKLKSTITELQMDIKTTSQLEPAANEHNSMLAKVAVIDEIERIVNE